MLPHEYQSALSVSYLLFFVEVKVGLAIDCHSLKKNILYSTFSFLVVLIAPTRVSKCPLSIRPPVLLLKQRMSILNAIALHSLQKDIVSLVSE